MKLLATFGGITVLILALGFWWFSPSEVIKRRTLKLLDILTFEPGSGTGARQMGAYSLNAILAPEVELTSKSIAEANGTFERAELESAYSWLSGQAKQSHFNLENINSLKIERDTATILFTLEALVELPSYRPADGRYQVNFRWQKSDDGWRLTRAEWQEAAVARK